MVAIVAIINGSMPADFTLIASTHVGNVFTNIVTRHTYLQTMRHGLFVFTVITPIIVMAINFILVLSNNLSKKSTACRFYDKFIVNPVILLSLLSVKQCSKTSKFTIINPSLGLGM